MASSSVMFASLISIFLLSITSSHSTPLIEDLNRPVPPGFNDTVAKNCAQNPAIRYCNLDPPAELSEVFKLTVVSDYLCKESKNDGCVDSFRKIDLRGQPFSARLYLSFGFFWKYCPLNISSIDLSNNSLNGSFPIDVMYCTQIYALDVSHNNFTGDLPAENLTAMDHLSFFNVSYNQFSQTNDDRLVHRFGMSSFIHSGLFGADHPKARHNIGRFIVLLCVLILFICIMVGLGCLCIKRPDLLPALCRRRNRYTLGMLKAATENFSGEKLLAKSGKVEIYKGELSNGTLVAIEIERGKASSESRKAFVEECKNLVKLDHKNLIKVLGWCDERELRAVVTKWINVDNVRRWLTSSPTWKHRLNIIVGVVEAMTYLQEKWPQMGYDLTTNTILLSEDMNPLISKFRVGEQNNSSKSVYKFGVFLLEMISSKHPKEDFERGEIGFIEWVKMNNSSNTRKVMDEKLRKTNIAYEPVKQGISIGLMCVEVTSSKQPSLAQVANMIKKVYQSSFLPELHTHDRERSNAGEASHNYSTRHER